MIFFSILITPFVTAQSRAESSVFSSINNNTRIRFGFAFKIFIINLYNLYFFLLLNFFLALYLSSLSLSVFTPLYTSFKLL